jgi:hypothetical protein
VSLTTNALNVAGSVGGVAQAVGLLASDVGGWASSLRPASYGGIPFGVESAKTSAGRKTAIHDYPFRDSNWVEDLGLKSRQFEISGFLVEDDLITKQGTQRVFDGMRDGGPADACSPVPGIGAECLLFECRDQ